jgi:hypothetical protein
MTFLGVLGTNEVIILLALVFFLLPFILFLLSQQNTLKTIQPQNRTMSPGEVWFQIIPLFGIVWQFIVVSRIADSIQRELSSEAALSLEQQSTYSASYYGPKPTYSIGITYCILFCCSIIPYFGGLAFLAGIICWIIYWVQLSDNKNKIQMRQYSRTVSQNPTRH